MAESKRKLILIAADESVHSIKAMEWYAEDLHRPDYSVLILFVAEITQMFISEDIDTWDTEMEELSKKHEKLKETFVGNLKSKGVQNVEARVIQGGPPGEIIVKEAESDGAMMVVMGTRGMGTIRRTVLGSVSDYVIHHAHCPVVIYRQ